MSASGYCIPWATPRFVRAEALTASQRQYWLWALVGIVALGVTGRIGIGVLTDFPINDGGLFYAFILEYVKSWPDIPATIAYNGYAIPVAYPPLSDASKNRWR